PRATPRRSRTSTGRWAGKSTTSACRRFIDVRPALGPHALVSDEPPAAAVQDRRAAHPACAVLHPPACRKPLDAAPVRTDPRAYRATRMAPDLIERRIDRTRAMRGNELARVFLKPTAGLTDPENVWSPTVMRRGD